MNEGYNSYDFHIAFHAIHNFCVTDMSNFYLDIIKDRLYCEKEDSVKRRAAQTAMYRILSAVARLAAPIISFTAEEIWTYMPHTAADDKESVFLNQMPEKSSIAVDAAFEEKWALIYDLRQSVNKALEIKRNDKIIGKSLEAEIDLYCGKSYDKVSQIADELAEIFIVSGVKAFAEGTGEFNAEALGATGAAAEITVTVSKASGDKCERCWTYSETVGKDSEHPTLCARCASVVK